MWHLGVCQKHPWPHLHWTASKIEAETKNRSTEAWGGDSGRSPSCDGKSITLTFSCVLLTSPVNSPLARGRPCKLYPDTTFDLSVLQSLIRSVQTRDKGKQQEHVTEDTLFGRSVILGKLKPTVLLEKSPAHRRASGPH